MSTSRALGLAAILTLTAAACAQRSEPAAGAFAAGPAAAQATQGALPAADRALRITIDTTIEVRDIDIERAAAAVRAAVARHGGYLGEAQMHGGPENRSAYFEAHVPVPELAAFRAELGKLGEVASDAEKAEDVTEQRADIKARLSNARAAEKRLLGLLEQRAGTLADVVAVEKELSAARETIERMEAQERTLEGQIQNATVKVRLAGRHELGRQGAVRRVARAAVDGIDNAGAFLVGVAVLAAYSGPTLLLLAAAGYAVFRVVRHRARRSQVEPTA